MLQLLSGLSFTLRGCVKPASWIALGAGASFTQPLRRDKSALQIGILQSLDSSSAVVVAVLRPSRPRPPAAGEDAQVGPPEGGVAQRVQNLETRKIQNV